MQGKLRLECVALDEYGTVETHRTFIVNSDWEAADRFRCFIVAVRGTRFEFTLEPENPPETDSYHVGNGEIPEREEDGAPF